MATRRWLGRAMAVAKVATHTVGGTAAVSQVYTVARNGKSVSYTASGVDTNTTIATALTTLLNASTITEIAEATWSSNTNVITSTMDTAGSNATFTTSATGTGTFVTATTTAASGPNRWDVADNWSGGAVPTNADDVIIDIPVSITDGLDQSGVTLTSLVIGATFENVSIGLPRTNASGYTEDRDDYLKIGANTVRVGVGSGQGSGRIKLNFGSVQATVEVRKTGFPTEPGIPALLLVGTHASNAIDAQGGTVGVAFHGGELATLLTCRAASGATIELGEGCTLGTISGEGVVNIASAVTTLTQYGGTWSTNGSGAITTLTQTAGYLRHNSSGTLTTATLGGTLDCSQDSTARTITNCTLTAGGRINDPLNTLTFSNGILRNSTVREIVAN